MVPCFLHINTTLHVQDVLPAILLNTPSTNITHAPCCYILKSTTRPLALWIHYKHVKLLEARNVHCLLNQPNQLDHPVLVKRFEVVAPVGVE